MRSQVFRISLGPHATILTRQGINFFPFIPAFFFFKLMLDCVMSESYGLIACGLSKFNKNLQKSTGGSCELLNFKKFGFLVFDFEYQVRHYPFVLMNWLILSLSCEIRFTKLVVVFLKVFKITSSSPPSFLFKNRK